MTLCLYSVAKTKTDWVTNTINSRTHIQICKTITIKQNFHISTFTLYVETMYGLQFDNIKIVIHDCK